ncbi:uncharacterized protein A1O9_12424 [Exophiala aquamarina CBS 119918]|uniref:Methyltransferase domain-containing protein n=1 Tax=Exophiala aquamarina CBS 119918 TaxID=1182545 RepID=A0A072NVT0_9EURO|nr:uncharacterized protein A1O9_12424 [Exophiala aquamarina CBS 119918]KEF51507.1 hypothetical protein A1O9_12424 [Exophiala aquamarina CBS 119918]
MRDRKAGLPISPEWESEDQYIQSLLEFPTTSSLFHNLCGGVHILDFLTREPDLYTTVLPQEWRDWFDLVSIDDVLDLLLRLDVAQLRARSEPATGSSQKLPNPPQSLLDYISSIRKLCLIRKFSPMSDEITELPRHVAVGMKPKKIHEVTNFAAYVGELSADLFNRFQEPIAVVDFGSGQNYLGRTLASPPYHKHVIAIERKHHNIDGARSMDVHARLAKKEKIMRNKKEWKRQLTMPSEVTTPQSERLEQKPLPVPDVVLDSSDDSPRKLIDRNNGSMSYVEHDIKDGHLESILYPADYSEADDCDNTMSSQGRAVPLADDSDSVGPIGKRSKAMVVSLHSCGNLLHHGLRSLILNPSICAVAMIGCCYNLLTERLGPATYKLPQLRPNHPRLVATGNAFDPHGFPMSKTFEDFERHGEKGLRLNITARMMAVQAPYNWGPDDSKAFFQRHFYRALLQRILLDLGVVHQCSDPGSLAGGSITGKDTDGTPLIVGSLRKACFVNFRAYVNGALAKLRDDPVDGPMIAQLTQPLNDDMIADYEARWGYTQKNLAVIWSLMAFSAGVVESLIAVDRYLFLKEQDSVEDCWVETVFDYKHSPRNLVVVGIKKSEGCS